MRNDGTEKRVSRTEIRPHRTEFQAGNDVPNPFVLVPSGRFSVWVIGFDRPPALVRRSTTLITVYSLARHPPRRWRASSGMQWLGAGMAQRALPRQATSSSPKQSLAIPVDRTCHRPTQVHTAILSRVAAESSRTSVAQCGNILNIHNRVCSHSSGLIYCCKRNVGAGFASVCCVPGRFLFFAAGQPRHHLDWIAPREAGR
jgi:hypothetical protein